MKKFILFLVTLSNAIVMFAAVDAQYCFEGSVPSFVSARGHCLVSNSTDRFKDGKESLKFLWTGPAELSFNNAADIHESFAVNEAGIMCWVYNTNPMEAPIRFTFWGADGRPVCWFEYNANYTGWRAIWMKYIDMQTRDGHYGDVAHKDRYKDVVRMTVNPSPAYREGTIYIDRLSFRKVKLHAQITPDAQIPENNYNLKRHMWHWCRTWEWSQFPELPTPEITAEQKNMVALVEKRLDDALLGKENNPAPSYTAKTLLPRIEKQMAKYNIRRLEDGSIIGQPLLSNDEYNNSKNEMRISYIQDLVYWNALDYMYTGNQTAIDNVILLMDHAIDQGFSWGSGMGTNHHYGYSVRNLYKGIWIVRKELAAAGKLPEYTKMLNYWSGVGEVRKPLQENRDEILDSWHTLQLPKVIAVMLEQDDNLRYAYLKALTDWTGKTMRCTNGTLGGIKVDGTSFHHGGHYPAYSVGAFASLGLYCQLIKDTDLELDLEGRKALKHSLLTLQNYSQVRHWGFGVCGRHPFGGKIPNVDVEAFAALADLGDLSGQGGSVDKELAAAYLALGGETPAYVNKFKKLKIKATAPAEGFTVYNYGAFGIHRRDGWMLTLKGFNSDVWSSEIYTHDNRFGRYLSYGTAQLMTGESDKESGYVQDGWDWNLIPGATAIYLPFDQLNSPNKGTLMERNDSRFPGVSSLEGQNGCLAFTYVERERPRFCKGATATKSVFCFDNRIVHIGTGITNNSSNPTYTTLYQYNLTDNGAEVDINESYTGAFPYSYTHDEHSQVVLTDTRKNTYIIKDAFGLNVAKKPQTSEYDTQKKSGFGNFITAYLNHGVSPNEASYEYMLLVQPSGKEITKYSRHLPYTVIQADNAAHVVKDDITGITAYNIYKGYASGRTLVAKVDRETIVMERTYKDGTTVMSICTPDLGITEKSYTTSQPSQPLLRTVELNGSYKLAGEYSNVEATVSDGKTIIKATCIHGQPVEFKLNNY